MASTTKKCLFTLLLFSILLLSRRPKTDLKAALDDVLNDLASHVLTEVEDLTRAMASTQPKWGLQPTSDWSKYASDESLELNPSLRLCDLITGKRLLFVGPDTTYHLHSLWLNTLEAHEKRSHRCLGRDYCNFHHICRPAVSENSDNTGEPLVRKKKIPTRHTLMSDNSSLLQYTFSTALYASPDKQDLAYILPQVDLHTQIRQSNSFWLRQARKADIIIMNRAPVPTPASTYSSGNWTFALTLCADDNYLAPLACDDTLEHMLINAAIHASVEHFFPPLLHTLRTVSMDPEIQKSLLFWHSSWYIQPLCASSALPNLVPLLQDIFSGDKHDRFIDPWSYYYNAQAYIHHRFLPKILPYFNTTYVSLGITNYSEPTYMRLFRDSRVPKLPQGKDCIRKPWPGFAKDVLENAFFGELLRVLEANHN